jgi:PPP family 3-phenylpropionic acid transporter
LKNILIFSCIGAVLRWVILAAFPIPEVALISQVLHAVTYGSCHIAGILYIDRISPAECKTLAQAVNNALNYGLGMMIGFALNGMLFEKLGAFQLFALSASVALMGVGVLSRLPQEPVIADPASSPE